MQVAGKKADGQSLQGTVQVRPRGTERTNRYLESNKDRPNWCHLLLFISLFNAQYVSDVNTSILRSLRLICWVISWVVLLWYDACWCYVVVWQYNPWITQHISRKLLRMDVLTSETCLILNKEIKKQVISSWSFYIHRVRWLKPLLFMASTCKWLLVFDIYDIKMKTLITSYKII